MKKSICCALTMSLAFAGSIWAYDAEYTAGQTATISRNGSYLVTGSGGGSLTVAANIPDVELTLRDVSWTGNATKINIGDGASVNLILEGSSAIKHNANGNGPGILLPQNASLTVSGTGSLNILVYNYSCIGVGPAATMGRLTMNSGTIVAHAGGKGIQGLCAAIGGTYGNPVKGGNGGTVVVNGGTLIAAGYSASPGIGGGTGYGDNGGGGDAGTLTVNGGHVIALSYLTGNNGDGDSSCAIGPGRGRKNTAYDGKAGRITVTGGILEAWVEVPASSCFGQARGNMAKAVTSPEGSGLYVTGGTVKWNHLIKDETDFTYSFSNCTVGCANGLESKMAGLWLPVNTDMAALFPEGVNFEKAPGETVAANALQLYDLAAGNFVLSETSSFTLVGSSASTANKIVASAGTTVEAAVCGVQSTGGWEVPAGTQITFWVNGGNAVDFNGVCCKLPSTGTLKLKGTGFWTFTSSNSSLASAIGMAANAGDWGTLEVDGPAITTMGSDRAPGVGGSYGYQGRGSGGGVVIVRSGSLTAYGYGGAAGIGGGSVYRAACGSGPQVTVYTNGTLYAYNMAGNRGGPNKLDGCGVAIGSGRPLLDSASSYAASNAGTIVVDGGTVYASAGNGGVSCFGCPLNNSNSAFTQNPNATGSLTVKNGGKVFFRHSTFPDKYAVTIDNGTLGTMSDSPAETWVTFNGLATVTNALTIAGPVAPVWKSLPSFKNNPALNLETGVTFTIGMGADEWIEVDDLEKVTLSPSIAKRTKTEDERVLTRFETRTDWINLAELNSVYEITTNGVYKFYGRGASTVAIRVAANVVCTNVFGEASLAVNGGSVSPLELGAGAQVFLQLMGENTMNRNGGQSGYAVIRVPEDAALTIADGAEEGEETGSLTIDESGLTVNHVVGIGEVGVDAKMGSLTIDSGNVTIKMRHENEGHGGAAIGSALQGSSCGTVTINGGQVDLDGPGLGPAIGAGTDNTRMGYGGNVTINGGTVVARGYGGASAIGLAPTYATAVVGTPGSFTMNGGTLYAQAFKGGSYGATQCGAAIGGSGTRNGTSGATIGQVTINGGNVYLMSEGAYSIGCGRPQNGTEPVARAATDRVVINGGNVWAEQGIQGEVVNAAGQEVRQVSIPSSHFSEYPCTLALDGTTSYTFPKTTFSDALEHLWLPPCVVEPVANLAIVVGGSNDETSRAYTLSSGAVKVYVAGKTSLSSASALTGAGVIVLSDGSETTFDGLDFTTQSGNGYHATVVVENQAEAKIVLKGANALKRLVGGDSVIHLPAGATLTIDGGTDDWLRIDQRSNPQYNLVGIGVSNYDRTLSMGQLVLNGGNVEVQMSPNYYTVAVGVMAGNRNAGTVIVNGGTLLAASGGLCAGIGGGYENGSYASSGGTVIVNGGVVTAKGYGGSAGIGGATVYNGVTGSGGSFTLNGGTVYAYAYKTGCYASGKCGAAIGGAAQRDKDEVGGMGTVTINDGTLYAYSDLGAVIGHGNTLTGNFKIDNGSDGAFTITGGSVHLVSGNGAELYHVTPKSGDLEPPLVTVPAKKFGLPPYALEFVEKDVAADATPLVYTYHGVGHEGDDNLYFYLPYGKYLMNGKFCVVDETGIKFPSMVILVR